MSDDTKVDNPVLNSNLQNQVQDISFPKERKQEITEKKIDYFDPLDDNDATSLELTRENANNKKSFSVSTIVACVLTIALAVFSCTVLKGIFSDPTTYASYIETLDSKQKSVLALSATTTSLAVASELLLGERANAISDKLLDLTSYVLIILCTLYLEKYLLSLIGYAAYGFVIPLACVLFAYGLIRNLSKVKEQSVKLAIFAVCLSMLIPVSVKTMQIIDQTYMLSINQETAAEKELQEEIETAIAEEFAKEEIVETEAETLTEETESTGFLAGLWNKAKTAASNIKDTASTAITKAKSAVSGAFTTITKKATEILDKAQEYLNNCIEKLAVLLITSCVIPLITFYAFFKLFAIFFKMDVSGDKYVNAVRKKVKEYGGKLKK